MNKKNSEKEERKESQSRGGAGEANLEGISNLDTQGF